VDGAEIVPGDISSPSKPHVRISSPKEMRTSNNMWPQRSMFNVQHPNDVNAGCQISRLIMTLIEISSTLPSHSQWASRQKRITLHDDNDTVYSCDELRL